jgi:hypothetical protein
VVHAVGGERVCDQTRPVTVSWTSVGDSAVKRAPVVGVAAFAGESFFAAVERGMERLLGGNGDEGRGPSY